MLSPGLTPAWLPIPALVFLLPNLHPSPSCPSPGLSCGERREPSTVTGSTGGRRGLLGCCGRPQLHQAGKTPQDSEPEAETQSPGSAQPGALSLLPSLVPSLLHPWFLPHPLSVPSSSPYPACETQNSDCCLGWQKLSILRPKKHKTNYHTKQKQTKVKKYIYIKKNSVKCHTYIKPKKIIKKPKFPNKHACL